MRPLCYTPACALYASFPVPAHGKKGFAMTRRNLWLLSAASGLALSLSTGSALAGATATIDNVTFPVGIDPSGSNQLAVSSIYQNTITSLATPLQGIGFVTSVLNNASGTVWQDGGGATPTRLWYVINNYLPTAITPIAGGFDLAFKGGTVTFYAAPSADNFTLTGNFASDSATIAGFSNVFLSGVGAVNNAAGDTLETQIVGTLTNFTFGTTTTNSFIDITGGDAGAYYNTNALTNPSNPFDPNSDVYYSAQFSTGATSNYPVSGSANIKANSAVPVSEPAALGVLTVGLIGLASARHRRRRHHNDSGMAAAFA